MKIIKFVLFTTIFIILPGHSLLAGEQWLTVNDKSLEIQQGSALDFSQIFPVADKINTYVSVNNAGQLSFKNGDGKRAKFLCAPYSFSNIGGFPDYREADQLAEQLNRHGYNMGCRSSCDI
ncbi:MAG: hypothetical protein KZQ74_11405 [gamma proteobacterium symbiont of Bathyaustriella thionipta]|nr:hypothetical protein [gamma proteobacterium symbiont of Bathyaustriella thionipta]MCU7951620.1 hypothetical protein [gamma proteobacterium symbiont of Bathyaustriella thionipta]MCU7967779.1 hypothetical protein [gamma proteobacterium symbiont of Bathyaustriella thionipta]